MSGESWSDRKLDKAALALAEELEEQRVPKRLVDLAQELQGRLASGKAVPPLRKN